jgi:hypothetical protein
VPAFGRGIGIAPDSSSWPIEVSTSTAPGGGGGNSVDVGSDVAEVRTGGAVVRGGGTNGLNSPINCFSEPGITGAAGESVAFGNAVLCITPNSCCSFIHWFTLRLAAPRI